MQALTTPDQLIVYCEARTRSLAHRMLARFPKVRRWDETDDIFQEALIRLYRSLQTIRPESELHLYRLAAVQIRRVLIDLARRYASRSHFAANHETSTEGGDARLKRMADADLARETVSQDGWAEFHRLVEELPEREREAFDLLWYMDLNQKRAAEMLGITPRSLQRRWRNARLFLSSRLDGTPPA